MLKKIKKILRIIRITMGAIIGSIIILAMMWYYIGWPVDVISVVGNSMDRVEDYADCYHYADTKIRWALFGSIPSTHIYFLPGQKTKMLKKIKEDVYAELDAPGKVPGGIPVKYEISDDFKKVTIYEYTGGARLDRVQALIGLYHTIKERGSKGFHKMIEIVP